MTRIYLGWGNPRRAYHAGTHQIVVLIAERRAGVLQGKDAVLFRSNVSGLTNHLCGVRKSMAAGQVLQEAPAHPHDLHAYNAIFDRFFALTETA